MKVRRWLWLNGLSLAMFGAFLTFITLQSIFGWKAENAQLTDEGEPTQAYVSYLTSGHFVAATFENWESEFLQMGSYIVLTAYLVQWGSAESKRLNDEDDRRGPIRDNSPAPSRHRGLFRVLYENSLAIVLLAMFVLSFVLHLLGGTAAYNDDQEQFGKPPIGPTEFLRNSEFWFQSMQNWQSEFLAVGVLIVASIFLRQRGSSQSKRVTDPHSQTGT